MGFEVVDLHDPTREPVTQTLDGVLSSLPKCDESGVAGCSVAQGSARILRGPRCAAAARALARRGAHAHPRNWCDAVVELFDLQLELGTVDRQRGLSLLFHVTLHPRFSSNVDRNQTTVSLEIADEARRRGAGAGAARAAAQHPYRGFTVLELFDHEPIQDDLTSFHHLCLVHL
jgi:hypothetical protein